MNFYDRKAEMRELERIYGLSGKSMHLTVLVGRRRVGKTRLVEEFMRDKPHIYLFVSRKSSTLLLEEFSEALRNFFGNSPHFDRWDDLFEYVFTHSGEKMVLVIDEFQNFRYSAPEVFSILQKVYDRHKGLGNVHIIALGSYISMMKRIFQDSAEPLFGRASEIMHLKEFPAGTVFSIVRDMGYSPEEGMELYSIFGGLPKYYIMLEEQHLTQRKMPEVLKRSFFTDFSLLRDEVKGMLIEDFGANYSTYFSILEAISHGYGTFTAISDKTGIKRESLSKYIQILRDDFGLISPHIPVTKEGRSKSTRYRISDNLVDFWFRFVFSQNSLIETGNYDAALKKTLDELPRFTSVRFEETVREAVRNEFGYETTGAWWSRRGEEIDIVAISRGKREVLFGEVKWRNRKMSCAALKELKRKAELTDLDGFKKRYMMVSKSGFTQQCIEEMRKEGVVYWTLEDVLRTV